MWLLCMWQVLVIIDAEPKDHNIGLPTEAYIAVEEVHDVSVTCQCGYFFICQLFMLIIYSMQLSFVNLTLPYTLQNSFLAMPLPWTPFSSSRQNLSYDGCLEGRLSELFCVVLCTGWAVLTVLWIGFCLTDEVRKVLATTCLEPSSTDVLPTTLLRSSVDVFAPVIVHMANLSFRECRFLAASKTAQVLPLLKKPSLDKEQMSSYRPISNLTTVSKVIEWLVLARLSTHLLASPSFAWEQKSTDCWCSAQCEW